MFRNLIPFLFIFGMVAILLKDLGGLLLQIGLPIFIGWLFLSFILGPSRHRPFCSCRRCRRSFF